MRWLVGLHDEFEPEFARLPAAVQDQILAHMILLAEFGPALGRPSVDTLCGSAFGNMKEMRFDAVNGCWRVAFAFDPARNAVVLVAGNKAGVSQKRFYRKLIETADRRFRSIWMH